MCIFGSIWILITDLFQLLTPRILGNITDAFQGGMMSTQKLFFYTLIIIGIALGIAIFRFLWRWFIIGTSHKLEYHIRNQFFKHLQKLSTNFFNHHKTGDLMAHSTNDINSIRMTLGPGLIFALD